MLRLNHLGYAILEGKEREFVFGHDLSNLVKDMKLFFEHSYNFLFVDVSIIEVIIIKKKII